MISATASMRGLLIANITIAIASRIRTIASSDMITGFIGGFAFAG